jgi:histidine ammonia-lyase
MGAYAARKAAEVVRNARWVLAVELLCAAQALEFGQGLKPGQGVEAAYRAIREHVPPLGEDRVQTPDIERLAALIADGGLIRAVEQACGPLELVS